MLLQLGQSLHAFAFVEQPLGPQVGQGLGCVLGRHLDQVLFLPSLGHFQRHLGAPFAPQPGLDNQSLINLALQKDFGRHVGGFVVELLDEGGHDLPGVLVGGALQDKVLPPDEFAPANEEDLHAGVAILAGKGDDIFIGQG